MDEARAIVEKALRASTAGEVLSELTTIIPLCRFPLIRGEQSQHRNWPAGRQSVGIEFLVFQKFQWTRSPSKRLEPNIPGVRVFQSFNAIGPPPAR